MHKRCILFPGKIPANLKSKSFKLGANYQPDAIAGLFDKTPVQAAQKPVKAPGPSAAVSIPVVTAMPSQAPQNAQTVPEKSRDEQQRKEMDRARELAKAHLMPVLYRIMGWGEYPETAAPDGSVEADWAKIQDHREKAEMAFKLFTRWRVDQRKAGRKLPNIYSKNGDGTVSIVADALEAQYAECMGGIIRSSKTRMPPEKTASEPDLPGPSRQEAARL